MFNEKSSKWIGFFKCYTIVMFWLCIVADVIMCFVGWSGVLWWTESDFIDGLICLIGGVFVTFVQLVLNMLIIQLLNNIQIIRENIEKPVTVESSANVIHEDKEHAKRETKEKARQEAIIKAKFEAEEAQKQVEEGEVGQPSGQQCQLCNGYFDHLTYCVIKDDMGTRYRNICNNCIQKYNAKKK